MFKITNRAKQKIRQQASASTESNCFPCVVWVSEQGNYPGYWTFGYYDADQAARAPLEFLYEVDGVKFIIDGLQNRRYLLDDTMLDFTDGTFRFVPVTS